MKKKISKILGVSLTVMLLASLVVVTAPAAADPDENVWSQFHVPKSGSTYKWRLAPNSTPASYVGGPIDIGTDGTLYAYANTSATTTSKFFKSTDDGHTWTAVGRQTTAIVDIACSPTDDDVIYIATATEVRASIDGGSTFTVRVAVTGETITSIDIAELGGIHMVLIGTSGGSYNGHVYLYNEAAYPAALTDMTAGSIDALAVAFSPDFSDDQGIFVAGLTSSTVLAIKNKLGAAAWGSSLANIDCVANNTTMASIAFPDDFDSATIGMANWYIGYNGAGTDEGVYWILGYLGASQKTRVSAQADIASLAVSGDAGGAAKILAGLTDATVIYTETGGAPWKTSPATGLRKQPTGASNALVLMADDFASSGQAWAATSGAEGAVSITSNFATTWNQAGLINTVITIINDLSFVDDTVFMATSNLTDSIWRWDGTWERVFHSDLAADGLDLVEVSPDYADTSAVFVAEIGDDHIWRSTDGGEIFIQQNSPAYSGASISAWVVVGRDEIIAGCANNYTYRTTNNGLTPWTRSTTYLYGDPYSLFESTRLAGYYMLGTNNGFPYYTANNGETWTILGASMGTNLVVDFGPATGIMWAVPAAGGVYRYSNYIWSRIDLIGGGDNVSASDAIAFASDGTLYATDTTDGQAVSRCLPGETAGGNLGSLLAAATYPYFEELDATSTGTLSGVLNGLWITEGSNNLWSVRDNNTIYTIEDTLTVPVTGLVATPAQTTCTLAWDEVTGVKSYTYEVNTRDDFLGTSMASTPATTTLSSIPLTGLGSGVTYYWRVRATTPVRSPYSDTMSFSTVIGVADISADYGAPRPGATDVPTDAVFTWKEVSGAVSYLFQITEDLTFYETPSLLLEDATSTTNTYVVEGLAYSTIYYWRVKAIGATTESAWVNGVFTTMAKPVDVEAVTPDVTVEQPDITVEAPEITVEAAAPAIPEYLLWTVIAIGALLIIALIVLIVRTRRVA